MLNKISRADLTWERKPDRKREILKKSDLWIILLVAILEFFFFMIYNCCFKFYYIVLNFFFIIHNCCFKFYYICSEGVNESCEFSQECKALEPHSSGRREQLCSIFSFNMTFQDLAAPAQLLLTLIWCLWERMMVLFILLTAPCFRYQITKLLFSDSTRSEIEIARSRNQKSHKQLLHEKELEKIWQKLEYDIIQCGDGLFPKMVLFTLVNNVIVN